MHCSALSWPVWLCRRCPGSGNWWWIKSKTCPCHCCCRYSSFIPVWKLKSDCSNTPDLWLLCLIFILVAVVGKFGGGAITARITGRSLKDSLSLGILMNTRGLMELIVLNIGLEMGILPPVIFYSGDYGIGNHLHWLLRFFPWLNLFPRKRKEGKSDSPAGRRSFQSNDCTRKSRNGKKFAESGKTVLDGAKNSLAVNVLHMTAGTDTLIYRTENNTRSKVYRCSGCFQKTYPQPPNTKWPTILKRKLKKINTEGYDFLLVGAGVSMNEDELMKITGWIEFRGSTDWPPNGNPVSVHLSEIKPGYFIETTVASVFLSTAILRASFRFNSSWRWNRLFSARYAPPNSAW